MRGYVDSQRPTAPRRVHGDVAGRDAAQQALRVLCPDCCRRPVYSRRATTICAPARSSYNQRAAVNRAGSGKADMKADHPLRFEPIFRRALWGGRRLETVLGKSLPPGNDFAESWEIVDHGTDQSRVTAGPLQGLTLSTLMRELGSDLMGRHPPPACFPLLLKFLDVRANLSVQVHPNDQQAAQLDPPDSGKSEAWYVLSAEPGSRIYAGLRDGVDRAALDAAVTHGRTEECLDAFEPVAGERFDLIVFIKVLATGKISRISLLSSRVVEILKASKRFWISPAIAT